LEKFVAVTGSVTIEHVNAVSFRRNSRQPARTKVDDLVYQGDAVRTGADGRVSINFTDGTSFNLTNNANMTLNEFVYDRTGRQLALFNLSKGTFTFCCWQDSEDRRHEDRHSVATMGIRGTTHTVEISDAGTVKFSTLIEEGKSKATKGRPGPSDPNKKPITSPI